jgi:Domain of unknown function (DUF4417)
MVTRTSKNWQELPGNFDTVNARQLFPSTNVFGIPELAPCNFVPEGLIPYGQRCRHPIAGQGQALHFFLDDYQFESVWTRPRQTFSSLTHFGAVLTPDFSLYRNYPFAVQLWNTYRNRWCGAYWQSRGLSVIPTVSWSDRTSFEFCFLGLPSRSVLAISTLGLGKDRAAQSLFLAGLAEMISWLYPTTLLIHGNSDAKWSKFLLEELPKQGVEVVTYASHWQAKRAEIGQGV